MDKGADRLGLGKIRGQGKEKLTWCICGQILGQQLLFYFLLESEVQLLYNLELRLGVEQPRVSRHDDGLDRLLPGLGHVEVAVSEDLALAPEALLGVQLETADAVAGEF